MVVAILQRRVYWMLILWKQITQYCVVDRTCLGYCYAILQYFPVSDSGNFFKKCFLVTGIGVWIMNKWLYRYCHISHPSPKGFKDNFTCGTQIFDTASYITIHVVSKIHFFKNLYHSEANVLFFTSIIIIIHDFEFEHLYNL